uniref:Uncharacterized protein n=1 Tax=Acrobeloides nanus TaxID=290746 RepID=A0A914CN42_9BILA
MFIFIIVEFPQGLIAVVQTLVTVPYIDTLGDLFEMLTLLTSCIIFAIFCSMNSRIRNAFVETAQRLCLNRFFAKKTVDAKHHLLIENTSSAKNLKFVVGDAKRTLL